MRRAFILFISFLFISFLGKSQELNCQVSVMTPQIQASDKTIYETLQSAIRDFMNNRRWTNDQFLNQERIECNILINVSERTSTDEFKGTIQVTSGRPTFNSSYKSPLINYLDQNFSFRYVQDQVIEFDEASITSNLTATLAFYAYIIIGLDYDSFSPEGGTPYFQKAQNIVNNAQNLPDQGWHSFEGTKNRYWLAENLLNVSFRPLRECLYKYHRLGFDKLADNVTEARSAISESLKPLTKVYNDKPNSFLMQVFFLAKADEIVNVYSQANPDEKTQIVPVLSTVDPANIDKYQSILK